MGLTRNWIRAVRAALRLDPDIELPAIDRMAYYRSTVEKCSSDGKLLDVRPINRKIPPRQNVELRTLAGVKLVVQPGAIVLYGWDEGDPSKPHCIPAWDAGATLTKFVIESPETHLGGEANSDRVLTMKDFGSFLYAWQNAGVGTNDGGATMRAGTIGALIGTGWTINAEGILELGSSKVKAQR